MSDKFNFDNERALSCILEWQSTKSEDALRRLFEVCDPMIKRLVYSKGIWRLMEEEEVISLIQTKIWRSLHHYDATRGTPYSFLTCLINNRIFKAHESESRNPTHDSLDVDIHENDAVYREQSGEGREDLEWRIMGIQTICTDEMELGAQKWLVRSFIDSNFEIKRHIASNAMSTVYGISRKESRQLHDYTLLEIRRALILDRSVPRATLESIANTRQQYLARYYDILSYDEFCMLVYLMKDLSVSIIKDVRHIIDGFPGAKPLFFRSEEFRVITS